MEQTRALGKVGGFMLKTTLTDAKPKGLGMQAANSTALDGFTNIPWQIKSLYGMAATHSIRGFHRGPYITAAGFVGVSIGSSLVLPASAFLAACAYSSQTFQSRALMS